MQTLPLSKALPGSNGGDDAQEDLLPCQKMASQEPTELLAATRGARITSPASFTLQWVTCNLKHYSFLFITDFSTNLSEFPIFGKRPIEANSLTEILCKMRALGSLDRFPYELEKVSNILKVLLFGCLTCLLCLEMLKWVFPKRSTPLNKGSSECLMFASFGGLK